MFEASPHDETSGRRQKWLVGSGGVGAAMVVWQGSPRQFRPMSPGRCGKEGLGVGGRYGREARAGMATARR